MSSNIRNIRPRAALAFLMTAGLALAGCSANGGFGGTSTSSGSSGGSSSGGGGLTVTITASSSTGIFAPGVPFTLSWTSSDPNAGCQGSGGSATDGWSGSSQPGTGTTQISELSPGTYTYTLTCADATGSGTGSVVVTVLTPTGGSSSSGASGSSSGASGSSSGASGSSSSGASGSSSGASGSSSGASGSSSGASGSSSGASGSSSGASGSSSGASGSSSGASGSSSGGSGSSSGGILSITLSPNQTSTGQAFNILYTTGVVSGSSSSTVCTASNTANDSHWTGTVSNAGGTVASVAPATANIYAYSISCTTTGTSGTPSTATATAFLFDGVPIPVATDCGVRDNLGNLIPTQDLIIPHASVSTTNGGLCLACSVSQPENVVDQDPTNYAVMNTPVGVASNVGLTVINDSAFPAGRLAGVVLSNPSELLTLNLLQGVTVSTLLNGQVQETAGASSSNPLHPDLLTLLGNPQESFLGFITSLPFDSVQISDANLVSAIGQLNVFQACVSDAAVTTVGSSSSSGGSSSSSSSSSGGSSGSSSSSGGSSSGSGPAFSAVATVNVTPNPVTAGQSFTLSYTVSNVAGSTCTAYNTAGDPAWTQAVTGSGSVTLIAPATANIYSYGISCTSLLGGSSVADAQLFDGIPATTAVDCGVQDNFGAVVPTQAMTDATASMSSATGGACLLCSVSQPQNVLDQDPINYAQINTPVGLVDNVSLTATNSTAYTVGSSGRLVGFVAADPSELLTLSLLHSVSVSTLLNGSVVESAGAGSTSPGQLDLLTLLGNPAASFVGFTATKPFNALQISDGTFLSAIGQLQVYHACLATQ